MFEEGIDVKQVLRYRLASSLGLDSYAAILGKVNNVDVSCDKDFQRLFNGFYRVRRNADWRNIYYSYFERSKHGNIPSFADVITYLYGETKNIEVSFASKMLATLDTNKPIWDRYVVQNLNLELIGSTQENKLNNAIKLYADIESWYTEFLATDKAKECIIEFDKALPEYSWISNIKKVDSILWSIR